jgi:hypothetical protein
MSEKVKYIVPLEITDSMIISSSAYDTPPLRYSGTVTYSLGVFVAVAGLLGEVLIYKSLQDSNTGNTPAAASVWWEYSSTTYDEFVEGASIDSGGGYPLEYKVFDTTTSSVWESLSVNNQNPFNVVETPPWLTVGTNTSTLPALWDFFATYAAGDYVYFALSTAGGTFGQTDSIVSHGVYKSVVSANTGNYPNFSPLSWELQTTYPVPWTRSVNYTPNRVVYDTSGKLWKTPYGAKGTTPLPTYTSTWVQVKSGNRSAMFDSYSSSQTSVNKSIKVQLTGAFATAIGFLNTNAETITVNIYTGVGGTLVYTNTTGLGSSVTNAWDYYFTDPSVKRKQAYLSGLPASAAYLIEVELTGADMVNLGHLILGTEVELGYAEYGLTSDITDFSRKVTDDFGRTTFVKRGFKRNMELQMLIPNENLTAVENRLEEVRSTPILVLASDNPYYIETVLRFCFYKTFRTEISYPTFAFVSIQFEGLI